MPNYRDPETLLIRCQEDEAARKRREPPRHWPSSPRAAAPRTRVPAPPLAHGREKAPPLRLPGTLTAERLKVSATLDAVELLAVPTPEGRPRVTLRISLPDRALTAEVAAKALRKAQRAIRGAGTENIVPLLQGRLAAGDVVTEAGISAQPKAAKPKQAP